MPDSQRTTKMRQPFNIPCDFEKDLPKLKDKTFQWRADLHLHEDGDIPGTISHYSIGPAPRGNMILAPGIASNTNIEPLMKAVTYWSLTHKYNVYCINSFLGDFKINPTLAQAQKNTYPEFINLMDMSLDIIEKHCIGTWTGLVGHSAGGTAAMEIFNRRIQARKKPRVSAAILFAPPLLKNHTECLKTLYRRFYHLQDISDAEFQKTPMHIVSPHDFDQCDKLRYVSIMPQFLDDITAQPLQLDLMKGYSHHNCCRRTRPQSSYGRTAIRI